MCDGNSHCGYVKIGNTLQLLLEGDAIGHAAPAVVTPLGTTWRDMLNQHHSAPCNAHVLEGAGPRSFGSENARTRIDYIDLPKTARHRVQQIYMGKHTGTAAQSYLHLTVSLLGAANMWRLDRFKECGVSGGAPLEGHFLRQTYWKPVWLTSCFPW